MLKQFFLIYVLLTLEEVFYASAALFVLSVLLTEMLEIWEGWMYREINL